MAALLVTRSHLFCVFCVKSLSTLFSRKWKFEFSLRIPRRHTIKRTIRTDFIIGNERKENIKMRNQGQRCRKIHFHWLPGVCARNESRSVRISHLEVRSVQRTHLRHLIEQLRNEQTMFLSVQQQSWQFTIIEQCRANVSICSCELAAKNNTTFTMLAVFVWGHNACSWMCQCYGSNDTCDCNWNSRCIVACILNVIESWNSFDCFICTAQKRSKGEWTIKEKSNRREGDLPEISNWS